MAGWILWANMALGDYGRVVPRAASAQRCNVAECERSVKLPDADLVVVDRTKVVDYLLNETHPDNAPLPSGGGCKTGRKAGFSMLRRCCPN